MVSMSILRNALLMLPLLTFLAILSVMELFKWTLQKWILSRNGEYLAQLRMFKAFLELLTTTNISFMILLSLLNLSPYYYERIQTSNGQIQPMKPLTNLLITSHHLLF
ncbi:hypothetical protein HK096_009091, partial [Nowakowskiella sp. JEL0078]